MYLSESWSGVRPPSTLRPPDWAPVTGILLARLLGPTGRGEYAALSTWFGLSLVVFELGIASATVYFVSRHREKSSDYVKVALYSANWAWGRNGWRNSPWRVLPYEVARSRESRLLLGGRLHSRWHSLGLLPYSRFKRWTFAAGTLSGCYSRRSTWC